jgi:cytochrome c oxidase accessory protein FixG
MSFDHKLLQLLFTSFDMQELYLVPFLLIMFFLGIFFITTLGGRIWCGWGCPQTIFRYVYRDLIQTKIFGIYKSADNKQKGFEDVSFLWLRRVLAFALFVVFALCAAADILWYFVPPEDFFPYVINGSEHPVLFIAWGVFTILLISAAALLKENFCIYVCPYVRIQSAMYDEDTIQTIYDVKAGGEIYDEKSGTKLRDKGEGADEACIGCDACVRVCPTHIDIRRGMQLECINCLECADACTKVMSKLGKPTLVLWTSPNAIASRKPVKFVRFRTVAYVVVLTIALIALLVMSSTKEHMLLNINRGTQLYSLSPDRQNIENAYTFLFQNTDSKPHTYYFEVEHEDIKIAVPSEPFKLSAGGKAKKVVVLSTPIGSSLEAGAGKPLDTTVKAYATDDETGKIVVKRQIMFYYPKSSEMNHGPRTDRRGHK